MTLIFSVGIRRSWFVGTYPRFPEGYPRVRPLLMVGHLDVLLAPAASAAILRVDTTVAARLQDVQVSRFVPRNMIIMSLQPTKSVKAQNNIARKGDERRMRTAPVFARK